MVKFNFYWPSWWKLWPWYSTEVVREVEEKHLGFELAYFYRISFAGFGPFQLYWYGRASENEYWQEE